MEQAAFGGAERVVFEHPRLIGIEDWSLDGRHILAMVTGTQISGLLGDLLSALSLGGADDLRLQLVRHFLVV